MEQFWHWLTLIGSAGFLVAIYFSVKLSKETHHERNWLMLALSSLFFAIHYWLMVLEYYKILPEGMIVPGYSISGLIGAALYGYASYGFYKAMVKIRRQTE